jgi:hypothetical protein
VSAWSDAFAELVRLAQPDSEPVLTKGGGTTADATKELDAILLANARGITWASGATVVYGDTILPLTRMGRRFRVTTGGVLGSTEPAWGDYEGSVVTSGTVVMAEDGSDFGNLYDVRGAAYRALDLKVQKAVNKDQYLQDARGQASSFLYLNLVRERDKYKSVGVA